MSLIPIIPRIQAVYQFAEIEFDFTDSVRATSETEFNIHAEPDGFVPEVDADGVVFWVPTPEDYTLRRYQERTSTDSVWEIGETKLYNDPADSFPSTSTGDYPILGLEFNAAGTSVWVGVGSGSGPTDYIEEYSLSTPFGGDEAYYVQRLAGPASGRMTRFTWAQNGTKLIAHHGRIFYDATLTTAYDISTAGAWTQRLDLSATYDNLRGFTFGKTEAQMILCEIADGTGNNLLHEYRLSTPGLIETAAFVRSYDATADGASRLDDVAFSFDGKKLLTVGSNDYFQFSTVN